MSTGQLSGCAMLLLPLPLPPEDAEVEATTEVEKDRAGWEPGAQEHAGKLR